MRPVSAKRAAQNRIRRPMIVARAELVGWQCEVPWCWRPWQDGHEPLPRGRGGSITDPENLRLVCRQHNHELTLEPEWGYRLDFLRHSS